VNARPQQRDQFSDARARSATEYDAINHSCGIFRPRGSNREEKIMTRAFLCCAVVLATAAAIAPATAQIPPPPPTSTPPKVAPPLVGTPKKKATPLGPSIAGNWSGQLTQVGNQTPSKFELAISAKGAETKYPDLDCTGKLTRVGSSKSYVFFVEIIAKGQGEKGGRCPDGTITVARQGDNLALSWFGSIQGKSIVAYGTLSKK
jgi:hypothetical protein